MIEAADEAMLVLTPGGVFSVRSDAQCGATAQGQLPFFAEYLQQGVAPELSIELHEPECARAC